jgi:rhomboid protease GluP
MNTPPGVPPTPPTGGRYVTVQVPRVRPVLTYILLGLTIFIFLLQLASEAVLGTDLPARLGMKINQLILGGEVWRLFTPMLLHGSLPHIIFNMYALYALGPSLESNYGHVRFLALYVIAGFAGNVLSFLFSPNPSLGSSTAIFGLIGAEAIFLYRNRELFGAQARRALMNVVLIAAANLLLGSMSTGIDNWGHIGGLLGGTFFAWFAGPLYQLAGDFNFPRLVDLHAGGRALGAAVLDLLVFSALAAMRFFRGF